MKFGYTIIYVADVEKTTSFYAKAFDLNLLFIDEGKQYAEFDTGATTLAFASEEFIEANGAKFKKNTINELAPGFEIAFVSDDVDKAYRNACDNGAISVRESAQKPWGQMVAHVRDINGILIEICSPMNSSSK